MGLGSHNVMITELSDSIIERPENLHVFKLLFQIYYSESDFVNVPIKTFCRPSANE